MQHARLYSLVGGVVAGTVLSSVVTHDWYSAVFVCIAFVSIGLVSQFVVRHKQLLAVKKSIKNGVFLACIFGLAIGSARVGLWMSFNHSGVLDDLANKKATISALVIEEPGMSDGSTKIIVETEPGKVTTASSTVSIKKAKVLVTSDRYSTVEYGDEIKLYGKVQIPKPIKGSDGESDFAYDVYLARQGIFYTMTFPSIKIIAHHHGNIVREYLIKIKNNFLDKINELFSEPRAGLLAGLLITGRSSLSKAEQNLFTSAGLIHIVALSGFNVTIIAQGLMALLVFLPKRLRLVIGAVGVISFVIMTGFGATIVRAGIMALLVIAAALVYRTYHVGRALFTAVLFMTLWDPMVVFDVSFQLSCIATFAVIFAAPPAVEKYGTYFFARVLPQKFKIRETMLGTAVIEIFLLPILLSTSGKISLVTVITNILVLPTLPLVMGLGFAATLLGYIHWLVALPLVAISNLMLEYILIITNFFANIPYGVFTYQIPEWVVFAIYAVLAIWLWRLNIFQKKNASPDPSAALSDLSSNIPTLGTALTPANLEQLDNFFRSRSNSGSQKKP